MLDHWNALLAIHIAFSELLVIASHAILNIHENVPFVMTAQTIFCEIMYHWYSRLFELTENSDIEQLDNKGHIFE